jgi:hypothetical protein
MSADISLFSARDFKDSLDGFELFQGLASIPNKNVALANFWRL